MNFVVNYLELSLELYIMTEAVNLDPISTGNSENPNKLSTWSSNRQ